MRNLLTLPEDLAFAAKQLHKATLTASQTDLFSALGFNFFTRELCRYAANLTRPIPGLSATFALLTILHQPALTLIPAAITYKAAHHYFFPEAGARQAGRPENRAQEAKGDDQEQPRPQVNF